MVLKSKGLHLYEATLVGAGKIDSDKSSDDSTSLERHQFPVYYGGAVPTGE
jgi:hypothetical protein